MQGCRKVKSCRGPLSKSFLIKVIDCFIIRYSDCSIRVYLYFCINSRCLIVLGNLYLSLK